MPIDNIILVLVAIIFAEVSYLTYRSVRSGQVAKNHDIFVDTSVLIDGRIVEVAKAGFLPGSLVIPRSVVGELQLLADTGDSDKRAKARRGLDVIKVLQDETEIDVSILADGTRVPEGVDERLLALVKKYGGQLLTIDYNLIKVAQVEHIPVLNINDLAKQLRMSYLPGNQIQLELVQPGSDNHQAVGYLSDGTMVVVEHAKNQLGNTVTVEIIRSLQTSAGRMMFAKVHGSAQAEDTKKSPNLLPSKPRKHSATGRKSAQQAPEKSIDHPVAPQKTVPQSAHRRPQKKKQNDREERLIELANRQ